VRELVWGIMVRAVVVQRHKQLMGRRRYVSTVVCGELCRGYFPGLGGVEVWESLRLTVSRMEMGGWRDTACGCERWLDCRVGYFDPFVDLVGTFNFNFPFSVSLGGQHLEFVQCFGLLRIRPFNLYLIISEVFPTWTRVKGPHDPLKFVI
jgi:hypothetical protein